MLHLIFTGFTVAEDAHLDTAIGTLTAEDTDKDQSISFSVQNSNYVTVKDDKLVVLGQLDFETSPNFTIMVVASDNALIPKSVS